MNFGFDRRLRLTRPVEFRRVFTAGRRTSDDTFVFISTPNALTHARLGLAIAKRAVPLAVQRNRLKRLVRESFRRCLARLPERDIVVQARAGARTRSRAELAASLERHWRRIGAAGHPTTT